MGVTQSRLQNTPQQYPDMSSSSPTSSSTVRQSPIISGTQSLLSPVSEISRNGRYDKTHFPFLDLPPEIRNMIYEELVVVGKIFYAPDSYDISNNQRFHEYKLFRKPELQLFRVCKQVHEEAENLYLSKNLFVLPIGWQQCHPFIELGDSLRNKPITERHVFSSAGLAYIRNVSVAVDQQLVPLCAYTHNDWKRDDQTYSYTLFSQKTAQERYEWVHEVHLNTCFSSWDVMLQDLETFEAGLFYVEVDCTNAFCAIGDCRPINRSVTDWIPNVKPKNIDVLGLQSMEEKQDILHAAKQSGVSHRELRYDYGLRFRKCGDSKVWDKWRM
ncbi:uncharacterized protein K460DRAFT_362209 [Cucurbitaria berberidis CBS 394.84]|uniref:Uncharacterized protein n=1 Tax=Cucurbitaria berberidis CBS 394.84 TaxID=1168544 RepID=A0A9P4LEL0_9PLEO|nr:uncharacterized protein K460DRAFT_362209 [Cucurbitaria berberidis CBS 394.84]KAF1851467.1 hypothetical protein K460DRAFT_362209 [Cucurbitaria berberidis CBS 394.84]